MRATPGPGLHPWPLSLRQVCATATVSPRLQARELWSSLILTNMLWFYNYYNRYYNNYYIYMHILYTYYTYYIIYIIYICIIYIMYMYMHIYILFGCIHIYDRTYIYIYIYIVWDCLAVCVTSQFWRSIIGLRGWVGRSEGANELWPICIRKSLHRGSIGIQPVDPFAFSWWKHMCVWSLHFRWQSQ